MMSRLRWIMLSLLAVILVLFVLSNPARLTLALEPLPWQVEMPVYLLVIASLAIGWLCGAVLTWLHGGATRQALRHGRRTIRQMEERLATAEKALHDEQARAAEQSPPAVSGQIEPRPGRTFDPGGDPA
ncbi:MAG: LapA family protein [Alphaproteobacteria bacterium]